MKCTHLMEIFLDASMAESRWSITLTPLIQDSISNQRRTNSINLNKSVAVAQQTYFRLTE